MEREKKRKTRSVASFDGVEGGYTKPRKSSNGSQGRARDVSTEEGACKENEGTAGLAVWRRRRRSEEEKRMQQKREDRSLDSGRKDAHREEKA